MVLDIFIVIFSWLILAWYKPATVNTVIPSYLIPFLYFLGIWVIISSIAQKYSFNAKNSLRLKISSILTINAVIVAITLTALYLLEIVTFSRLLIFGTVGLSSVLEIILAWQFIAYQKTNRQFFFEQAKRNKKDIHKDNVQTHKIRKQYSDSIKRGIIDLSDVDIFNFIKDHMPAVEKETYFTATRRSFNITNKIGEHSAIVNLQQINTVPDINNLFNATNEQLPLNGYYFSIAEIISTRKEKILKQYPLLINQVIYILDYLFHRVFAKVYPTRHLYKLINHKNKALSKAELLGRLYASGFEVINEAIINDTFVFISKKVGEPKKIDYEAIGGLIKLRRLGKDGKIMGVYKFRTMHPYSEYIQEYVYKKNSLQEGGKFKSDFRINRSGRFMRKMWIDELPMFLNVFKGEMKIVGVRPLSKHYFSLYTKELQDLRTTTKPGLLPPFYADSPVTLEEIMASEMRYLKAYKKHPILTDIKYFFKIFYNITIRGKRSK